MQMMNVALVRGMRKSPFHVVESNETTKDGTEELLNDRMRNVKMKVLQKIFPLKRTQNGFFKSYILRFIFVDRKQVTNRKKPFHNSGMFLMVGFAQQPCYRFA